MLHVHYHRKFFAIMLAGSALLVVGGSIGFARAGGSMPLMAHLIAWPAIAAMAWGSRTWLRQLLNPPLMYSADRRGVTLYFDAAKNAYAEDGVFLPWRAVSGLALQRREGIGANSHKVVYIWVIACALDDAVPFPVARHSVAHQPQDGDRIVCLDAFFGNLARQPLLVHLHRLWQAARRHPEQAIDRR